MKELNDKIQRLVAEEVEKAYKEFGPFHDAHQGYALILEECEEAAEELAIAKNGLAMLWESVRKDQPSSGAAGGIWIHAEILAAEAIHVAVTANRMVRFLAGAEGVTDKGEEGK